MKNDYYCLRSEEEHHVCNGCENCYCYDVKNDNGQLCIVQFIYSDNDGGCDSMSEVSSSIAYMIKQNLYLDELKSKYMALAHELKDMIHYNSCKGSDVSVDSEKRIKKIASDLYDDKEDLINEFNALMKLIDNFDCQLEVLKE